MGAWNKWAAAAFVLLALVAGGPARAQVPDPFARELAQKLTQAEFALSQEGYMRAAGPFPGGVGQRESRQIPLSLRAGQDYGIVGVCDSRCTVTVRLLDANGAPVAHGIVQDGASVMRVRPRFTSSHMVEVDAARCAAAQCWYAVNVYTR